MMRRRGLPAGRPDEGTAPIVGVGIDTEPWDALGRFAAQDVDAFAGRRLTAAERAWCAGQPAPVRSVVACVCGKEAVWKATAGRTGTGAIEVAGPQGLRSGVVAGGLEVALAWRFGARVVLVTAIACERDRVRGLV